MSPAAERPLVDTATSLPSPRIGVILCPCHESTPSDIDLKEIALSLASTSGVAEVGIIDNLCNNPQAIGPFIRDHHLDFLLVGGCDETNHIAQFREQVLRSGIDPLALWAVSLADSATATGITTRKAKIRLLAALERSRHFSGSKPENLKSSSGTSGKEISRRDFLQPFRVCHQPIPVVDEERCRSHLGCSICPGSCPTGSLAIDKMELSLFTNKCTGCGICLSFCPWEALRLPLFNTPEIEAELRVLLSHEDAQPRNLIFTCTCSSAPWRRVVPQESPSGELVEYPLPCLGMASPYLMVRAFTLGASSIILATRERCPYGFKKEQIMQRVEVVRHILTSWEQDPERLQSLNVDDPGKLTSQSLPPFNLRHYKKPVFTGLDLNLMTWQSNHLGSLMKQIALQAPPAKTHPLTNAQVPLAIAHVDSSLCTLCGLCAERCPATAITIRREDDLELTFQYDKCVGCGSCEAICPEKCLRLTQTLDPIHLLVEKEILCRGEILNCRICGSFITSQKTANKILEATQLSDAAPSSYMWNLCPTCRPQAFLQ